MCSIVLGREGRDRDLLVFYLHFSVVKKNSSCYYVTIYEVKQGLPCTPYMKV